jgi:hypothetical protein
LVILPVVFQSKAMPEKVPGMCPGDDTLRAYSRYPYWCLIARLLVGLENIE